MGKKVAFERAHQRRVKNVRERRERKSAAAKAMRRGDDTSSRLIQRTNLPRTVVSDEKKELLVKQFAQACRLPATSDDLCLMLRSADGDEKKEVAFCKRGRDDALDDNILSALVDAFLQLEHQVAATTADNVNNDEDDYGGGDEPITLLEDVIQDECGGRVACALITALKRCTHEKKAALLIDAVTRLFEENETLCQHFVACKVMSSLVQHGGPATQKRILQVLRHHSTTVEHVQEQLRNRHSAVTIQHLIEHLPDETVTWLTEALGIGHLSNKKKKGKISPESYSQHESLLLLIHDPVAFPVVRSLILHSSICATFLKELNILKLLESKRGCKFLRDILSSDIPKWTGDEASAVLETVFASCEKSLENMCTSSDANFVVQAIIRFIQHTPEMAAGVHFKRLLRRLGPHVSALVVHNIGVHVVVVLLESAFLLATSEIVEEIASIFVSRSSLYDLLRDPNGSLVVRKLLPLCSSKNSKVGQLLVRFIEQDIITLSHDAIGNLVVQEYIKIRGGEDLASKLIKSNELIAMCWHMYASHVVESLFDNVGASTHSKLCNTLRPHVVALSKHLNGRFVVEKAVAANRDICELLLCKFLELAYEKGTQHVLCVLLKNLSHSGKQRVVDVVTSELAELATQQSSSVVLQKLMLTDAEVLRAVQKELAQKQHLRNKIAQNYYGKFVVRISDSVV